ncbi:MAG: DUF6327 family protein [Gelidibacter sp.]
MKGYTSFDDIENDLKRLKLERDIAWEELKVLKSEFKQDLQPYNWMQTALKYIGKYGVLMLFKKILK